MAEYKITVDFKSSGGGGSKKAKGYQSVFSEWADDIKSGIKEINGDSPFNQTVQGIQALANVIPAAQIVKSGFDWQVSLIGRYKGSQQAQDIANASMKIAGQVGGIALAFATGNYVAGGLMTIGTLFGYAREAEENTYQRKWENIGNAIGRERAGASFNRSRTEG
nr:MAG TPA: hypothetical protein [Caudoviricetes sp.]